MATLACVDCRRNITRDAVDGPICLRICDVSEPVPILVDKKRVVRVYLSLPLIVLRDGDIIASNQLRRFTKLGANVRNQAGVIKCHLKIQAVA